MTSDKKGRRSDRPTSGLQKERESFIQSFFRKGAQLTQELVKESERLHQRVGELEQENAQLRSQIASDDAIRELLRKIETLEHEREILLSRYEEAEAASVRYVDQYTEVETELANLANLYVASYQLHGSLDPGATLRNVKEMLEQLVGLLESGSDPAAWPDDVRAALALAGYGGQNRAPIHLDGVIGGPTLIVDGDTLIRDGEYLV